MHVKPPEAETPRASGRGTRPRFDAAPRAARIAGVKARGRIGIFGGSFDPVHVGHLSVAQQVADELDLDQVILIPAGEAPHKLGRRMAPAADRLEMVRLAIRGLARLSASDVEVRRSGPSYTLDTVREIKRRFGPGAEYFLIIGADTAGELPSWHRAADLVREVRLAIAPRPGFEPDWDAIKAALGPETAPHLRTMPVPLEPCGVSSTEVRARAARGEDLLGLVRAPVAEHIARQGLYRE